MFRCDATRNDRFRRIYDLHTEKGCDLIEHLQIATIVSTFDQRLTSSTLLTGAKNRDLDSSLKCSEGSPYC